MPIYYHATEVKIQNAIEQLHPQKERNIVNTAHDFGVTVSFP
jgi:hypothetical protein